MSFGSLKDIKERKFTDTIVPLYCFSYSIVLNNRNVYYKRFK